MRAASCLDHHRRGFARDQLDLFARGRLQSGDDAGAIGDFTSINRAGAVGVGRHKVGAVELVRLEANVPLAIVERAVERGDDVINLRWFFGEAQTGLPHLFQERRLADDKHARAGSDPRQVRAQHIAGGSHVLRWSGDAKRVSLAA